jgi:hypothetical protein
MPKIIDNPPSPENLIENIRQFSDYTFSGALADLIDNSIYGNAKKIEIIANWNNGKPEIRVIDDGKGLNKKDLKEAMRWASKSFSSSRALNDLGRFGLGLKVASLSKCNRLIVSSTTNKKENNVFAWDTNRVKETWGMDEYSEKEKELLNLRQGIGTEIIWQDCSLLTENFTIEEGDFNTILRNDVNFQLGKIFHRFLEDKDPVLKNKKNQNKIQIYLNGNKIEPNNPFFETSEKIQYDEEIRKKYLGKEYYVNAMILPSWRDVSKSLSTKIEGIDGKYESQGFYLYRNKRLIVSSNWFNMRYKNLVSDLIRIRIDIDNNQDAEWQISGNKTSAQMPVRIKNEMKGLIERWSEVSKSPYQKRSKKLNKEMPKLWKMQSISNGWRLKINSSSEIINSFKANLSSDDKKHFKSIISFIEDSLPIEKLSTVDYKDAIINSPNDKRQDYMILCEHLINNYLVVNPEIKSEDLVKKLMKLEILEQMPEIVKDSVDQALKNKNHGD